MERSLRARRAGLAALLLAVPLGCRDSAPPPKLDERHIITIEGSRVQYNGQELRWDVDVDEWQKVLGPRSRRVEFIYVWDDLGVIVGVDTYDMTPRNMQVQFGRKGHSPLTTDEPDYWPSRLFTGRLMVDGALVHAGATVPEVNRGKKGPALRRGHLETIFVCDLPGGFSYGLEYGYDFTLSSFSIAKPTRREKPPDWEKRLKIYNERCQREKCDADQAKERTVKPTDWEKKHRQMEEAKKVKRPW